MLLDLLKRHSEPPCGHLMASLDESPPGVDTGSSPDWTPPSFAEVAAALGCHACDACSLQWCTAVPGKAFFNARCLRACPKIQPIDECLPLGEAESTL